MGGAGSSDPQGERSRGAPTRRGHGRRARPGGLVGRAARRPAARRDPPARRRRRGPAREARVDPVGAAAPRRGGATGAGGAGEAPPRERHTRRGSRKATPGSTTYDEAKETPLDPEWEGGAWYGPSSNTYWTINPREYADPRKHGPEYQARARRAAQERSAGGDGGPADLDGSAARPPTPPSPAGPGAAASPRPPMAATRAGARTAGPTRRRRSSPRGGGPGVGGRVVPRPAVATDGVLGRRRAAAGPRGRRAQGVAPQPARAGPPAGLALAAGDRADRLAAGRLRRGHADLDHDRLRPVRRDVRRAVAAGAARRAAADRGGAVRGPARRGRRGVRGDRRAGRRRARRGRAVGERRPRVAGRCRAPRRRPSRSRTSSPWSGERSRCGARGGPTRTAGPRPAPAAARPDRGSRALHSQPCNDATIRRTSRPRPRSTCSRCG